MRMITVFVSGETIVSRNSHENEYYFSGSILSYDLNFWAQHTGSIASSPLVSSGMLPLNSCPECTLPRPSSPLAPVSVRGWFLSRTHPSHWIGWYRAKEVGQLSHSAKQQWLSLSLQLRLVNVSCLLTKRLLSQSFPDC